MDLDLGGANLHTILGVFPKGRTIHDFFRRDAKSLEEIILKPDAYFFDFIPGLVNALPEVSIPASQRSKLIRHLKKLTYDFILIDLGAGISPHTLDFFNIDAGILITLPDPASVENLYRFLRAAFTRRILQIKSGKEWREFVKKYLDKKGSFYFDDLEMLREDTARFFPDLYNKLQNRIESFRPYLIVNMVKNEREFGNDISRVTEDLLGIQLKFLGNVSYDNGVVESLRRKVLAAATFPDSVFTRDVENVVDRISKELVFEEDERLL